MRTTGIALMAIGFGMLLFAGVMAIADVNETGFMARNEIIVPLFVGLTSMMIGGVMYFQGWTGVIATRDPAVRR